MIKKRVSMILIFMLALLALIPEVQATTYNWNMDVALVVGPYTDISDYWASNGYWDVKGFQWGDPDTTYPSDFSYSWQSAAVTVSVDDSDGDLYQGTVVGAVRQGSVWDLETAPWYDQTTYQPTPLHFGDMNTVSLTSRVRIDQEYRKSGGWMNWLFNPWFRVSSTYLGVTKERKMVWDIVWGWSSWLGFPNVWNFVDSDENIHLYFFMKEMAQTGDWNWYTVDLLEMAGWAKATAYYALEWDFEVDDLYLWSIDALVEGHNYNSTFSVDFLEVTYEYPPPPPPGGGCPYVSTWNGTHYVLDNNLLPTSEASNGTDVVDYYMLQQTLAQDGNGTYSLMFSEFENEHDFFDRVQLAAVDHSSDVNVAVSSDGEILTYTEPSPPVSAIDDDNRNVKHILGEIDGDYYEGYNGSYITLNFGDELDVSEGAKLVMRADFPLKMSIHVQVQDEDGNWNTVATVIPRVHWATEIVDLSEYLPDPHGNLKVRLYFTADHKVDFVGLDTSPQATLDIYEGQLFSAIHSTEGDITASLLYSDDEHAELVPEQEMTLRFTLPPQTMEERSYILVTEGYYFTIET